MTSTEPHVEIDGRRARRERGRRAVIDALVDLVRDGYGPPTAQAIADRAGVSVSSLFRYFDNLDELRDHTVERFFERYDPLFEVPALGEGDLPDRVERFVAARTRLYDTIAPIARLARFRSFDHPTLATSITAVRARLTQQVRDHFTPELALLRSAERDDVVALIATLTSFEAWDLLRQDHGRSARQVQRAWTRAIRPLLPASQ